MGNVRPLRTSQTLVRCLAGAGWCLDSQEMGLGRILSWSIYDPFHSPGEPMGSTANKFRRARTIGGPLSPRPRKAQKESPKQEVNSSRPPGSRGGGKGSCRVHRPYREGCPRRETGQVQPTPRRVVREWSGRLEEWQGDRFVLEEERCNDRWPRRQH